MRASHAALILYDRIIPFPKHSVNAETAVYYVPLNNKWTTYLQILAVRSIPPPHRALGRKMAEPQLYPSGWEPRFS